MTIKLFLVILAILAVVSVTGAWLLVRRGRLSSRDALLSLASVSLLVFLPLLMWLAGSDGDQGQGYCQVEIHISRDAGEPGVPSDDQRSGATGEENLRGNQDGEPSYAFRQKCVQGLAKVGFLQIVVTGLTCAFILLVGFLTHVTATGERAATRARLIADLPDVRRGVVRLVNLGSSPGFVIALGASLKDDSISRRRWPELEEVVRLVPPGEENAVEVPLVISLPGDDGQLVVLIRYRDAYKETWEAWRIVSISPSRTVVVKEDGERRSRG